MNTETVDPPRAKELYDDDHFITMRLLNFYGEALPEGCIGTLADVFYCLAPEHYALWYRPIWIDGCGHLNAPGTQDPKAEYLKMFQPLTTSSRNVRPANEKRHAARGFEGSSTYGQRVSEEFHTLPGTWKEFSEALQVAYNEGNASAHRCNEQEQIEADSGEPSPGARDFWTGRTPMGSKTELLSEELEGANYTNIEEVRDRIQLAQLEVLESIDQTLIDLGSHILRITPQAG